MDKHYLDMGKKEILKCFFADTFISHTRRDRVMDFPQIKECYYAWCEATGVAPTASPRELGGALAETFFKISHHNRKLWFCEIRKDLLDQTEEMESALHGYRGDLD